jgi:DNA-binding transcriptional regulator LsrR (DeoR family)
MLAQVASWYYEEDMSLRDIAKRLDRSVSLISRMLQEARELSLVEIRIRFPNPRDNTLEARLCALFGISQAWVLSNVIENDAEALNRRLGNLGAECLQQLLHEDIRIGLCWGKSIDGLVNAVAQAHLPRSLVVQISGASGSTDPTVDGAQIAQRLATRLTTTARFLHAPLVVESEELASHLRQDKVVAETLRLAAQVDIAIVGVGTPYVVNTALRRAGYITEEDVARLESEGVVGDIMGFQMDRYGQVPNISLNRRIIGLHPSELLSIPNVILTARGTEKKAAILAALRGGYVDILVTDASTALGVIELHMNQ